MNKTRQTLLFSATLNQKTQDLVKFALLKKPLYIGVVDDDEEATVEGLTQEYIHRVGRTARGENQSGNALLFIRPEELGFLRYLKRARVPLQEYAFNWNRIAYVQNQDCFIIGLKVHRNVVVGPSAQTNVLGRLALEQVSAKKSMNGNKMEHTCFLFFFVRLDVMERGRITEKKNQRSHSAISSAPPLAKS
ncbi:putative ATP-dependent RNA helicase pitchoune [Araneus ventricosus]|uniref:Putative ATP-dependent RNA helicase pitchoune n=1 Tax=Araneus ventricosus TaxID=182803 RepID=A0A4Y2R0S8_ARAVE|nr:putative ATP-dependent RNA helicase pitchoune [Araneus ventricosus]